MKAACKTCLYFDKLAILERAFDSASERRGVCRLPVLMRNGGLHWIASIVGAGDSCGMYEKGKQS